LLYSIFTGTAAYAEIFLKIAIYIYIKSIIIIIIIFQYKLSKIFVNKENLSAADKLVTAQNR